MHRGGIEIEHKKYDLPQFLMQRVIAAEDMLKILSQVEPQYNGHKRTAVALQTYLALAARDRSVPLPSVLKTLANGDGYAGVEQLAQRLRLSGDLPQS